MDKKRRTRLSKKSGQAKNTPCSKGEAPRPYHLTSASWQAWNLKNLVVVKLSRAIDERGFSQRQAAEYLGVSQPRISDLMRGNIHLFSLDTLIEWMLALDKPVTISFNFKNEWGRSRPQEWTEEDLRDKIAYYDKVIKYNPDNSAAYKQRAFCHCQLKQFEQAVADYTHCLEMDPGSSDALEQRAMAYHDAGNHEAALYDLNEFMSMSCENDGFQNRALVFMAMNDLDSALKDCNEAIARMKTPRPGPYWNRALIEEKLELYNEAIADCQRVLEADPTYKNATEKAAALKLKLGGT